MKKIRFDIDDVEIDKKKGSRGGCAHQ